MSRSRSEKVSNVTLVAVGWPLFLWLTLWRDWPMWQATLLLVALAALWTLVEIAVGFVRAARRGTPS